ncbi:zinc finger protein 395b isoform X1 [Myxocyprinus asiaticus]|uniref:zinc finger protein 395b isoform X1 n=1 Tax=Myxocyprinus asiaticus TaxID=70543 RepID=UPI0022235E96|nr:zinc finger protein 395b isoform X1 [Myxocyprinus asiaticus]XP_051511701.1 zinc finger protein 395b isoform X1 [Myxocyprinus asiaticus]
MAAVGSRAGLDEVQTSTEWQDGLIYMQSCGQGEGVSVQKMNKGPGREWSADANTQQTKLLSFPRSSGVDLPYRSPESVEMDEIMAAMVLTSLSCSPVVQSPPQRDLLPGDMECGGGELSDSGSSGYWSWDHGSVSPAPSPSVTEMDRSPGQPIDEGLHMELDQAACEELEARRCKSLSRGAYRCLWPGCGKVLTSRVGMKRHIRILHLGRGSEQSHREEDFYYTEVSSEDEDTSSPSPSFSSGAWTPCGSTQRQSTPVQSSPLSQSAPSSVWQIHTEHLYQACTPIQITVSPGSPTFCSWIPPGDVQQKRQIPASRSRSVSVGEQWLQRNSTPTRSQTMSASPSRGHCSFRKGRGDAKKCRKVYGVERRDQWCTACRWKKACQRFPD